MTVPLTSENDGVFWRPAPGLHEVDWVSTPQRWMTREHHTGSLIHTPQITWHDTSTNDKLSICVATYAYRECLGNDEVFRSWWTAVQFIEKLESIAIRKYLLKIQAIHKIMWTGTYIAIHESCSENLWATHNHAIVFRYSFNCAGTLIAITP